MFFDSRLEVEHRDQLTESGVRFQKIFRQWNEVLGTDQGEFN